jgi:hypothetical protein
MEGIAKGGIEGVQGRAAPQAEAAQVGAVERYGGATIDPAQQAQIRQRQMQLADQLRGVASGQQRGAGELAAQRQGSRAIASQQAMAQMGRGANAAMAARGAARNVADIGGQVAGQAQQAALQDQAAARAQLGGVLGQARGADIGLAQAQAGLSQQAGLASMSAENQRIFQQAGLDQSTSLANMQAKLQTMGMNDQAILGYLGQLYGMNAAELQARMQQEALRIGSAKEGMLPDLLQMGGTLGAAYAGR